MAQKYNILYITNIIIMSFLIAKGIYASSLFIGFDSIYYISLGEYFGRNGEFPYYIGGDYFEYFLKGKIEPPWQIEYPNYFYCLTIALLYFLFEPDTIAIYYVMSAGFTLAFIVISYYVFLKICEDKLASLNFSLVCLACPCLLSICLGVMTDLPLLCFFALSIFFAMEEKYYYSGLVLGAGFCFREQALFLLPVLPLCAPHAAGLSSYFKNLSGISLVFCIGIAVKLAIYYIYFYPALFYYVNADAQRLLLSSDFSPCGNFGKFLSAFYVFIEQTMPVSLFLFLFSLISFYGKCRLERRIKLLGLAALFYAVVAIYLYWPLPPDRYYIYSCFLGFIALILALKALDIDLKAFSAAMLVTGTLFSVLPYYYYLPRYPMAHQEFREIFDPDSKNVFLSSSGLLPYFVQKSPVSLNTPAYKFFYENPANYKIDYIFLFPMFNADWPMDRDIIKDRHGNEFRLLTKITDILNGRVYKRI